MRLLFVLMLVLSGIAAGGVGAAAQDDAAAGDVPRTNVRFVIPYSQDGLASGLTVTEEVSGFCATTSLADVGRPDAWVCTNPDTGERYDPCFENPFGDPEALGELACMTSPFSPDVVRLALTEPLRRFKEAEPPASVPPPPLAAMPPGQPGEPALAPPPSAAEAEIAAQETIDPLDIPWGLELANGAQCTLLTGASAVLAGERVNYGCDDGGLVLGEVDRSAPQWAVSYLAEGAFATDLVPVAVAWT